MKKRKGSLYPFIVLWIILLFFVFPSLYVCYEKYEENKDNYTLRKNSIMEICNKALFPENIKAYEWIFTTPGIMMILGILTLITSIILYDMQQYNLGGIEKYKKKKLPGNEIYNEDEFGY